MAFDFGLPAGFDSDYSDDEKSSETERLYALPLIPSSSQRILLVSSRLSYVAYTFGGTPLFMTLKEELEVFCRLSGQESRTRRERTCKTPQISIGAQPVWSICCRNARQLLKVLGPLQDGAQVAPKQIQEDVNIKTDRLLQS